MLFLYPASTLAVTLYRFWGLADDKTAENLARDILDSLPQDSVLIVGQDTALFTTQYLRYAQGIRPDTAVIHRSRIPSPGFDSILLKNFPSLTLPRERPLTPESLAGANREKYPVYTNEPFFVEEGWLWVPYGLVYRLTREEDLSEISELLRDNDMLWDGYHDSTKGILARYNHLMLSDVRSVYAQGRVAFGKTLLKAGRLSDAKRYFDAAADLEGDSQQEEAYTYAGLAALFDDRCDEARIAFVGARETALADVPELTFYEAVLARDCFGDESRAKELFSRYEELLESRQTRLPDPQ